jgi:hypothetical protein
LYDKLVSQKHGERRNRGKRFTSDFSGMKRNHIRRYKKKYGPFSQSMKKLNLECPITKKRPWLNSAGARRNSGAVEKRTVTVRVKEIPMK